jgi:hypothetical protein
MKQTNGVNARSSAAVRLPRWREMLGRSGAGRHVGSQDVVRVAVEVLAGAVITHGRARIGMAGGDLDVPQVDPGIQHGCDERMSEHV